MITEPCIIAECTNLRGVRRRNLCNRHYRILHQSGSLVVSDTETMTVPVSGCTIDECGRPAQAKGLCSLHYGRQYHFGDARLTSNPNYVPPTIDSRFWRKVVKSDDCWLWAGTRDEFGKGWFIFEGKLKSAHRYSYMKHCNNGEPLPRRVLLGQSCGHPSCVNPEHLKITSGADALVRSDST